jgi:putative transposase
MEEQREQLTSSFNIQEEKPASHVIPSEELSEEAKLKLEIIQSLLEPCDRATYGKKLKEAAQKLGKSVRTVQRLVKRWEEEGISALSTGERSDQGDHRIDSRLEEFILKTYKEGNKGSKPMTRKQVYLRTQTLAKELGLKPLSHMTVYRVLQPVIEAQEKKKSIRSPGWLAGFPIISKNSCWTGFIC